MGIRERNRQATRARILDVCEALLRARGFEAATIDDIIGGADVSRQTFFNHFSGKQAVVTELWLGWLEAQAAVPPADPDPFPPGGVLAAMKRAVLGQARAIAVDREFMVLLFTHAWGFPRPSSGPDRTGGRVLERAGAIFDGVAGVIRAGQASGEIRSDLDPRRAAEIYVSAMLMTVRLWLADDPDIAGSLEERMVAAIDLLARGLRPAGGEVAP